MELARTLAREKGLAALLLTARREAVLTKLKQELEEVKKSAQAPRPTDETEAAAEFYRQQRFAERELREI